MIEAPTVQMILKLQATKMNPLEWQEIRDVLEINEEAFSDIRKLCSLLRQPGKERKDKDKENKMTTGYREGEAEGDAGKVGRDGQRRREEVRNDWNQKIYGKYH